MPGPVAFECPPFTAHPAIRGQHSQTVLGAILPRRFPVPGWQTAGTPREFTMPDGDRLTAVLHRHPDDPEQRRPLLLLISGLEGDVDAPYMRGMSSKAYAAGYHSLRLNYRGCGGTEHLSQRLYNSAMIEDVDTVIRQLGVEAPWPIVVAGVSLGANKVLRLMGTYGANPPSHLLGSIAISPPIDLSHPAEALKHGFNRVYDIYFLLSLKRKMRRKLALNSNTPGDLERFRRGLGVRTLQEFDEQVTAPLAGHPDALSYYRAASTLDQVSAIQVPTLLLHAKDDPLIPMTAYEQRAALLADNPAVTSVFTEHGGHVGFMQAPEAPRAEPWMDAYWAENTAISYVRWLEATRA